VTVTDARLFMSIPDTWTEEDVFIADWISAAREQGEIITGRGLAQRTWTQVLDSFPYYTDTIQSQSAYPPAYYSLPRYSSTLWNYSQMIKLAYPPVISVEGMVYVDSSGNTATLEQDVDFVLDRVTEPPRIFPLPGQYWPASMYVANSLQINFTAGYDPDPTKIDTHEVITTPPSFQQNSSTIVSGIPRTLKLAILNLVAFWYENRGAVGLVPANIERMFMQHMMLDFCGTRG
jgi:hypothetical protein